MIEIFGRINSVAKTLNPMEKLNAQYSGEFKQFCLNQAVARLPFWRSTNIFSANDIARMQEVQFMSDFTVNLIEGLSDYDPKIIQRYYGEYDEHFPQEDNVGGRMETIFERLVALPVNDFTDTVFIGTNHLCLMYLLDENRHRMGTMNPRKSKLSGLRPLSAADCEASASTLDDIDSSLTDMTLP